MIGNYYGLGLAAYDRLTMEQQSALSQAFGVLNNAGLESTGFRVAGPVWQPGDVVVVRFHSSVKPYTYVRGAHDWPGDRSAAKSDASISDLFRTGKATHVLRDGKPVAAKPTAAAAVLASTLLKYCDDRDGSGEGGFAGWASTTKVRRIVRDLTGITEAGE